LEKIMLKPVEICDEIIEVYSKKVEYPAIKSIILGILAGSFVAIGGFSASLASHSIDNIGASKFIAGVVFPVGLILVLLCGGDLFTGNVLLTVPLAEKKIKLKQMLKNLVTVYFSNLLGAFVIALLIYKSGLLDTNSFKLGGYAIKVAVAKTSIPFSKAFASGILCNIVVCLAVWISNAAKDVAGKILAAWFPIMAFVISGFEHSVANMYYFSIGLLAKSNPEYIRAYSISADKLSHLNLVYFARNLIPVTLGNIVGGALFVGLPLWVAYKYTAKTAKTSTTLNNAA
jgi:formate transporter